MKTITHDTRRTATVLPLADNDNPAPETSGFTDAQTTTGGTR